MNPAKTHGAFSWSELMTSDPASATKFYSNLFGWSAEVMQMSNGPYTIASLNGFPVAGLMDLPQPGIPTNWFFYVTVDDVDATAAKAVDLGATVMVEPIDVPDVGRLIGLTDPQGAFISIITYNYPQAPPDDMADFTKAFATHGAFSWFELRVPDVGGAESFYSKIFGWNIERMDMPMGPYNVIKIGEVGIGGIMSPPPEDGIPPHWGAYVTVNDADAIAAKVTSSGGTLMVPPMDIPEVGRFTMFSDAQGGMLAAIKYLPMNP